MKQEVDSKRKVHVYQNERCVIFKERNEGARKMMTTDGERVLQGD